MKRESLFPGICLFVAVLAAVTGAPLVSASVSMSLNGDPVPDVDKVNPQVDQSCWLAAAADVLGAAGWGIGAATPMNPFPSAQARAERIYNQLWDDLYRGAGGDAFYAVRYWVQHYGWNRDCNDYDPNNPWWGQCRVTGDVWGSLSRPQYNNLMDQMDSGKYVNVVFDFLDGYHVMTAVELQAPGQVPSYSVWHDNNGDNSLPPGDNDRTKNYYLGPVDSQRWGIDSPYDNDPEEGFNYYSKWAQILYPVQYAPGEPTPIKPPDAVANFDVNWYSCLDNQGHKTTKFSVTGAKAGVYRCPNPEPGQETQPYWENPCSVVIPNECVPEWTKEVWIQIYYAQAQAQGDTGILLALPWGQQLAPDQTIWTLGGDVVLLHWTVDGNQPQYEKIIFPDGDYYNLFNPETGGGKVYDWNLASLCVPEPATMALLTCGALAVLRRGSGRMLRRRRVSA